MTKLFALPSLYRQGDLQRANLYEADIAALLQAAPRPTPGLLAELRPHLLTSDIKELAKILDEIAARRERFRESR